MSDGRPVSHCMLDLAPPDIAWFRERSDIILVPIGSCEQHGAHLPIGTDTITALEVSRRAAAKADVPYTAPFWAGYSPQHMRETESSVGTITLRAETLNAVLYDILRSLIHHGWNKLILVNGHGSNTRCWTRCCAGSSTRPARWSRSTSPTPSATSGSSTGCSRTRRRRRPAGTRPSSRPRR